MEFVDPRVRGIVDPYWDNAPVTCETLWAALEDPVRVTAIHAMFAGPEIMMGLPESAQRFDPRSIPAENQTCFPTRGEVLWFYQGRNVMKGLGDELWEIGLFYDNGARIHGPLGWTPCNMLGIMREGIDEFAALCADTRISGIKTVEIGRLS